MSEIFVMTGKVTIDKYDAQGNLIEHVSTDEEQAPVQAQSQPADIEHYYTLQEWSGSEDLLSLSRTYLNEIIRLVADGVAKGFITR